MYFKKLLRQGNKPLTTFPQCQKYSEANKLQIELNCPLLCYSFDNIDLIQALVKLTILFFFIYDMLNYEQTLKKPMQSQCLMSAVRDLNLLMYDAHYV